jgi:hypothetical protein
MEALAEAPLLGEPLAAVARRRLGDSQWALALADEFLGTPGYQQPFASSLAALSRNRAEPWPMRKAAALMLEHQLLRINESAIGEQTFWLDELRIPSGDELHAEGYRSTKRRDVASEFRQRLARNRRIHERIDGYDTTADAFDDFLALAARDCRILSGRYLWSVEEVVDEIERQVRRSRGVPADAKFVHPDTDKEIRHQLDRLPRFEREIVLHLMRGSVIRWVSEATPVEINSLVEYPLTSVVLVIKPPGSDVEIEIKRAGIRGPRPFDIKIWRDGKRVPRSHHLQGGSMTHLLSWESCQSGFFSRLYRLVHGEEAAMSRTMQITNIFGIPSRAGELSTIEYFTRADIFDRDFAKVHADIHFVADILSMKDPRAKVRRTSIPKNTVETAVRLLGVTRPAQAVQVGNSSFRLDKLAHYLGAGGPAEYFGGLGRDYTSDDARRFADELLDEVLCFYEPPNVPYRDQQQYVRAAFRVPSNRERARQNYLTALEQLGRFWGTLYGAGGHTDGESFVGRNTGLRTVWENGEWRIRMTFMDHDGMQLIGQNLAWFHPRGTLADQRGDHHFIFGRNTRAVRMKGALGFLSMIYRVNAEGRKEGIATLKRTMKEAFDQTREALRINTEVRDRFNTSFIERLEFWHEAVKGYLSTNKSRPARNRWHQQTAKAMHTLAYPDDLRQEHFSTLRRRSRLLNSLKFLYV